MSALAEALVAAQRRALSAMEKAYVAGRLDGDELRLQLDAMGLSDDVDTDRLLVSLTVIRDLGAAPPAEPTSNGAPKGPEPASDAQLALIAKLVKEKQAQPPRGAVPGPLQAVGANGSRPRWLRRLPPSNVRLRADLRPPVPALASQRHAQTVRGEAVTSGALTTPPSSLCEARDPARIARRFLSTAWNGTDAQALAEAYLALVGTRNCGRCGRPYGGVSHGPGLCGEKS